MADLRDRLTDAAAAAGLTEHVAADSEHVVCTGNRLVVTGGAGREECSVAMYRANGSTWLDVEGVANAVAGGRAS